MVVARFVLVAAIALLAAQDAEALKAKVSPVRRVINMLTMMQKKCEEQVAKEAKIFDKFMCSCKGGKEGLLRSIADARERIPQLESGVQETKAHKDQLEADIEQQKADRSTASSTIEQAEAMRNRDKNVFERDSANMAANINAMGSAVAALASSRDGAGFLQTGAGQTLGRLSASEKLPVAILSRYDKEALESFLQAGTGDPGEILGVLNHMRQDMSQDLQTMTQQETNAVASFEAISLAKNREIAVASAAIEDKQGRHGEISVFYVEQQHDLGDTREGLATDQAMFQRYQEECDSRQKDYAVVQKTMAEEQVAIADTVKILNDEGAQRLFARTLPGGAAASASFLQVNSQSHGDSATSQAVHTVQRTAARFPDQPRLVLLANRAVGLARGHSSNPGFAKIITLVEQMIELLAMHQQEDDLKKEMCNTELEKESDHKTALEEEIKAKTAAAENTKDQVDAIAKEIGDLQAAISELDQSVSGATQQRQEENAEYLELIAGNNAAVELLHIAQNRLQKFYNPDLHQPATALVQDSSQAVQGVQLQGLDIQGVEIQAPSEISVSSSAQAEVIPLALLQLSSAGGIGVAGSDGFNPIGSPPADFAIWTPPAQASAAPDAAAEGQDDLAPPPAQDGGVLLQTSIGDSGSSQGQEQDEFGFFAGSSQSSSQSGASDVVIRTLQMIQVDLQHEIVAAKAEEEHAQQDYQGLMAASQTKRQADAAAITEKEGVHAGLKENMDAFTDAKEDLTKEKMDTEQVILNLHKDCDWLLENFDVRRTARAEEKESLQKAMSVLHGADSSLVQSRHRR